MRNKKSDKHNLIGMNARKKGVILAALAVAAITILAVWAQADTGDPYITFAEGEVGNNQITIFFNEGVYANSDGTGALATSDFFYVDNNGAPQTITGISHSAGDSTVTLTLNASLVAGDLGDDADAVACAYQSVYDSDGNYASTAAKTIRAQGIYATASLTNSTIPTDTDGVPLWGETATICVQVTDSTYPIDTVMIDLTPLGGSVVPMQPVTGPYGPYCPYSGDGPYCPYDPYEGATGWFVITNATNASAFVGGSYVPHELVINLTDSEGNWETITVDVTVVKNGDVNEDYQVRINDALYVARYVIFPSSSYPLVEGVADVNGDGDVWINDALYLARHVIGQPGYGVLK